MPVADHLGFRVKSSQLIGRVLVPKYYSPEVTSTDDLLQDTHDFVSIGELMASKELAAETGDEIGKMAYGTGTIPFVRTSDIFNWEIKSDPKQGVSESIYNLYAGSHDVRAGDVLFVRDGTYLIGAACMVTPDDGPMLYQSHILKFRCAPEARVSGPLLLALLSCTFVRRQIKSKQFTADIIDSIGNRYTELVLPIPKDPEARAAIDKEVRENVHSRAYLRERLRRIPFWAQGLIESSKDNLPTNAQDFVEETGNLGFVMRGGGIARNVFLPRYYNPIIEKDLQALADTHNLVSLGEMVEQKTLTWATGIEVGKMAYGMGTVPFIRTSDISNWELKADPKQGVSEELYEQTRAALDVQAEDIFIVRDGTYLVGTSCILTEHDTKILYCGGLYKLRVLDKDALDPFLLLALLNAPLVRRQMKAKQFTRDVIDTLGKRLFEVVLPVPKDDALRAKIAAEVRELITTRVSLRNRTRAIAREVESIGGDPPPDTDSPDPP